MRVKHYDSAATFTITGVSHLHRVLVNTGVASGAVTVRYADTDDSIAVLAADNPDIGRVFDLKFDRRTDLEVVLSDGSLDVTVIVD